MHMNSVSNKKPCVTHGLMSLFTFTHRENSFTNFNLEKMKNNLLSLAACTCIFSAYLVNCSSPAEKLEDAKAEVKEADKNLADANQAYLEDIENYKAEIAEEI